MTAAERDVVFAMMRAYYAEDGHRFDAETAARALSQIVGGNALARLWLIQNAGKDVGYLCVTLGFSLEVGGGDFFLDEIYVRPEARRLGIGRAAIALAEQESRSLGARRLVLEVEKANPGARRLYESLGFVAHERHLMSKLV